MAKKQDVFNDQQLHLPEIYTEKSLSKNLDISQLAPKRIKVLNDPPYGSRNNPITELTDDIKTGKGWAGHENLMESWLVLLASYSDLSPQRQIAQRGYFEVSKNKARRFDLMLRPRTRLYRNVSKPVIITDLKSTYVDDTDVADICLTKAYPNIAYREYVENSKDFETVVVQLVSPAGITEGGVKRLDQIQETLSSEYGDKIRLDAITLEFMVWHQIYPIIVQAYQDNRGAIGKQFSYVKEDIKKLCNELCYPRTWVEPVEKIRNENVQRGYHS